VPLNVAIQIAWSPESEGGLLADSQAETKLTNKGASLLKATQI